MKFTGESFVDQLSEHRLAFRHSLSLATLAHRDALTKDFIEERRHILATPWTPVGIP
jgi:hypothetical protein